MKNKILMLCIGLIIISYMSYSQAGVREDIQKQYDYTANTFRPALEKSGLNSQIIKWLEATMTSQAISRISSLYQTYRANTAAKNPGDVYMQQNDPNISLFNAAIASCNYAGQNSVIHTGLSY